jgi:hypothetical protein
VQSPYYGNPGELTGTHKPTGNLNTGTWRYKRWVLFLRLGTRTAAKQTQKDHSMGTLFPQLSTTFPQGTVNSKRPLNTIALILSFVCKKNDGDKSPLPKRIKKKKQGSKR